MGAPIGMGPEPGLMPFSRGFAGHGGAGWMTMSYDDDGQL